MSTTESHEGLSTDISRRLAPERTSALHGVSPGRLSGRRLDMSTDLTLFTHPVFGNLRTIVDGETIYICAKDAATALGYSNTNDAIKRHCKGVVKRYPLETPGGTQEFAFIYESDLYRLIIGSKLPAARQFESWVMDEVLPSIRKHGLYITDRVIEEIRTNPKALLAMLQAYVEEKERNEALAAENLQQAQQLLEALHFWQIVFPNFTWAEFGPWKWDNLSFCPSTLKGPERVFCRAFMRDALKACSWVSAGRSLQIQHISRSSR